MRLIKPSFEIQDKPNGKKILKSIERAGRTCYKSEKNISDGSATKFVKMVIERGHTSVIEHEKITVRVICDRGITHEIVRHRLASYSQESTRYCNYSGGVTFIIPPWVKLSEGEYNDRYYSTPHGDDPDGTWLHCVSDAELHYKQLLKSGWTPQQARSVLPNSLKTEIVMTMNLREWRWFFKKRASNHAHPQMRELAFPMLEEFQRLVPVVFEDLTNE